MVLLKKKQTINQKFLKLLNQNEKKAIIVSIKGDKLYQE